MKRKYERIRIAVSTLAATDIICTSTALTDVTLNTLKVDASKIFDIIMEE